MYIKQLPTVWLLLYKNNAGTQTKPWSQCRDKKQLGAKLLADTQLHWKPCHLQPLAYVFDKQCSSYGFNECLSTSTIKSTIKVCIKIEFMFSQMTLILEVWILEVCYEGKRLKARVQKPLCFLVYWSIKVSVVMQAERLLWLLQLLPLLSRKLKYLKNTATVLHRSIKITRNSYPSKMKWLIPAAHMHPLAFHYLPPDVEEAPENRRAAGSPERAVLCSLPQK